MAALAVRDKFNRADAADLGASWTVTETNADATVADGAARLAPSAATGSVEAYRSESLAESPRIALEALVRFTADPDVDEPDGAFYLAPWASSAPDNPRYRLGIEGRPLTGGLPTYRIALYRGPAASSVLQDLDLAEAAWSADFESSDAEFWSKPILIRWSLECRGHDGVAHEVSVNGVREASFTDARVVADAFPSARPGFLASLAQADGDAMFLDAFGAYSVKALDAPVRRQNVGLTLDELRTEAIEYISGFSNVNFTEARLDQWIRWSVRQIENNVGMLPFARVVAEISVEADQSIIDLPEDVNHLDTIRQSGDYEFYAPLESQIYDQWGALSQRVSFLDCKFFRRLGRVNGDRQRIEISPAPSEDTTFEVSYWQRLAVPYNDDDQIMVPDEYVELVALGAARRGVMLLGTQQQYDKIAAEYKTALAEMRQNEARREPVRFVSTRGQRYMTGRAPTAAPIGGSWRRR